MVVIFVTVGHVVEVQKGGDLVVGVRTTEDRPVTGYYHVRKLTILGPGDPRRTLMW